MRSRQGQGKPVAGRDVVGMYGTTPGIWTVFSHTALMEGPNALASFVGIPSEYTPGYLRKRAIWPAVPGSCKVRAEVLRGWCGCQPHMRRKI